MGAIHSDAVVLLDGDGVSWSTSRQRERDPAVVWCGSLKAWAVLQAEGQEGRPVGSAPWALRPGGPWNTGSITGTGPSRTSPQIRPHGPVTADLAELLRGDLATPALISLALLPIWTRQLASCSRVTIPVGRHFRPPPVFPAGGSAPPGPGLDPWSGPARRCGWCGSWTRPPRRCPPLGW